MALFPPAPPRDYQKNPLTFWERMQFHLLSLVLVVMLSFIGYIYIASFFR